MIRIQSKHMHFIQFCYTCYSIKANLHIIATASFTGILQTIREVIIRMGDAHNTSAHMVDASEMVSRFRGFRHTIKERVYIKERVNHFGPYICDNSTCCLISPAQRLKMKVFVLLIGVIGMADLAWARAQVSLASCT